MNLRKVLACCVLLVLSHLICPQVNAQNFDMNSREWSSIKNGSALKSCWVSPPSPPANPCDTLLCQVDFFSNPTVLGSNFNIKEIRSFVKFYINHNDANIYAPFTYQLSYQLKGYRSLNPSVAPEVIQDTLMVNYNPDSINAFQDIHMRSYYGYYRIEVKVLDIFDCTATYAASLAGSSTIPPPVALVSPGPSAALNGMKPNWGIEAGMVQQTFDLGLSTWTPSSVYSSSMAGITLAPTHSLSPNTNILKVSWDLSATGNPTPALYELEWTYADNYGVSLSNGVMTVANKSNVPYDFRDNSSRIITAKTSYEIPLVYKRGYVAYRVRLLRPDNVNYLQTKYGPWSNVNDFGTVGSGAGFYGISSGHLGDQLNWNYEATYAEEGKSKQVLGYFDGLLKSRQSVTRFGSRPNELIGAEQFYDYEGRVGLQTLPVPVQMTNSNFGFIPNFALSSVNQQPYTAADIDPLIAAGNSAPLLPGLHANSAAKGYYSPQNPLLGTSGNSMIKAVPDAEGFPLIHSRHTPDDPERLKIQGGAGKELQIGKGHETSYFYSDPLQGELNPYFGANIGIAKFYEKVITSDPNKELSFSVLNNAGKPVMTGMMGFPSTGATLLNLDGVNAPSGSQPFTDLFYGNPPVWSGSQHLFNKTYFKEASGGYINYSLSVPAFAPCSASSPLLKMNVPIQYGVAFQNANNPTPFPVISSTTITPGGGSATGPTVSTTAGTTTTAVSAISLASVPIGENTIQYSASYNPDHIDSAVKLYLRNSLLYPSCYKSEADFMNAELASIPDNCEEEVGSGTASSSSVSGSDQNYSSTECGQYEGLMTMQMMAMGTYGTYIKSGKNKDVIVGNGRSLFAIVGWTPKVAVTPYVAITAVPTITGEADFVPTCYPAGITYPANANLSDSLDATLEHYDPKYAYQYYYHNYLTSFSVNTEYNGATITVNAATPVDYLLEVYNSDIAAAFVPIHPEYCDYKKRYCDASGYSSKLQNIPSLKAGQQLQLSTLQQLVDADPFKAIYLAQSGNTVDGLKNMEYKIVDGSGIIGTREVQIDYFAYYKVTCDATTDPAACLEVNIPNSLGSPVTPSSNPTNNSMNLATLVANLSSTDKELYYQQLLDLYLSNRGTRIARYKDGSYICGTVLPLVDTANQIFREFLDVNGNPTHAGGEPGTPSYQSIMNGNFVNNINSITGGLASTGGALSDLQYYSLGIIKQLLNCREVNNQNYNANLFSALWGDIDLKMRFNIMLKRDNVWKGGISPEVLRELMVARGINLDDLCNPYLVSYSNSPSNLANPCGPVTGNVLDTCEVLQKFDLSNSFLKNSLFDIYEQFYNNPISAPLSGQQSVNLDMTKLFDLTLTASLGFQPLYMKPYYYDWTLDPNGELTITFTNNYVNNFHQVSLKMNLVPNVWGGRLSPDSFYLYVAAVLGFTNANMPSNEWWPVLRENTGLFLKELWYAPGYLKWYTANRFEMTRMFTSYPTLSQQCNCSNGFFVYDPCPYVGRNPAPDYGDTLIWSANYIQREPMEYPKNSGNTYDGYTASTVLRVSGLDLSLFTQLPPPDSSLSCMHTCIACSELKEAYKTYQKEVVDKYGIKGKGHPYYETSVRNFLNYYFRNRHFSDEYMNFMKGCSLSDSLLLPQYYGYFQAAGTASQITSIVNVVRSYSAASPAVGTTISGPDPTLQASLKSVKFFRYTDAGGIDHLYIDFLSVFQDERLRPFINYLTGWLNSNAGTTTWSFNKLNSEISGQPAYSADIFLPGASTAFSSSCGASVTSENVTVKDAGPGSTIITTPFTHYRYTLPGNSSATGLASTLGLLGIDLKAALQTGISNYEQISSHESFRNTHSNSVSNKLAYLNYAYGLSSSASHDNLLTLLSASTVQSTVYTTGSTVNREVSYRHGADEDMNDPSGTMQLNIPNSTTTPTPGYIFLGSILDKSKGTYSSIASSWFTTNSISQGSPLLYSIPGGTPNPANTISFGSLTYKINSVKYTSGNIYAYVLKPTVPGNRNYNVRLRLPDYVTRSMALKYDLVSISPMAFGDSKRYFKAVFQLPGNTSDTFGGVGKTDFDLVTNIPDVYQNIMLCDKNDDDAMDSIVICYDALVASAIDDAAGKYARYQDSLYNAIRFEYRHYIDSTLVDKLEISEPQMKYAITLYDYDRAGNLIQTVPPMGVNPMSSTSTVDPYRDAVSQTGTAPQPVHSKVSIYTYGAMNQKLTETTPDGGLTKYMYDVAGRLIFSQTSSQVTTNRYTYTLYDQQNRLTETGQIQVSTNPADPVRDYVTNLYSQSYSLVSTAPNYLSNLIANVVREEVTRTTYDDSLYLFATTGPLNNGMSYQENLRSRVAAVALYNRVTPSTSGNSSFDVAIHYSYDLGGNVKTLTYDMPGLEAYKQRYKRIDYDYDLYSGKVTLVSYNRGFADQYYQRYSYDDDNRITKTETSKDGLLWDRDAEYKYYPHGPLARMSLGDQRVQGVDFAYTLQGWLKSINGDSPDAAGDMGGDGLANNAHQPDLYRTTLSYFDGDYKPLDPKNALGTANTTLLKLPPPAASNRSLYNGNIAASVNLPGYFPALYSGYRYDKLNRIKEANYELPDYASATPLGGTGNPYSITGGLSNIYHNDYTYDLDGNIITLNRFGFKNGSGGTLTGGLVYQMDQLDYKYISGTTVNNRLTNFTDAANHSSTTGFTNDLAPYTNSNALNIMRMMYDPSGRLIKDLSNGLSSIDWTLYGKTKQIVKDDGHVINFYYDPMGNRLIKRVSTDTTKDNEYLIREANGNVLATYRQHQHYHWGSPFQQVIDRAISVSAFPGALSSVLGSNGNFSSSLISETVSELPTFTSEMLNSKSVSFYVTGNGMARSSLLLQTPNAISRIMQYSANLATRLYPADHYNAEVFAPLINGITDSNVLSQNAGLLFNNPEVRTRYANLYLGDSLGNRTDIELGSMLANDIRNWRLSGQAPDKFKNLIWDDADTTHTVYTASTTRLLADSSYLQASPEPGSVIIDEAGNTVPFTLNLQLKKSLSGLCLSNEQEGVMETVNGFLGQYYSTTSNSGTAMTTLRSAVGDEALLQQVYASSPTVFINALLANSTAGSILSNAMGAAVASGSISVPQLISGITANSTVLTQNISVIPLLDYDRLYLADHTIYGSSRLGLKKYWPGQYRYEWRGDRTVAQNQVVMDSSEFSYRRPWYYQSWQSLITANQVTPLGNANADPQYSTRIIGQKQYELSNHLGNVMAVVTDKVTETPAVASAGIPSAVAKHAGLHAAYDYYPFGMIMPERSVEDNSIQCIPVSRTRWVNQVTYINDVIAEYDRGNVAVGLQGINGTSINYMHDNGVYALAEHLHAVNLDMYLDMEPLPIDAQGVVLSIKLEEGNGEDVNQGNTQVTLNRLVPGGGTEQITAAEIVGSGVLELTADNLNPSDQLRLTFSYMGGGQVDQVALRIPKIIYSVIVKAPQTYVAMSCDTDGYFRDNYRYGFNGQQKDNEIAGSGNSLDFKFRGFDSRLGRFKSIDPMAPSYPWNSAYAFAENRVIDGVDLEGREWSCAIVNGRVQVTCNVQLQVSNDLTVEQIAAYKQGISQSFNKMIQVSTGGFATGQVTFNGKTTTSGNRLVPTLSLDAQKYSANARNHVVVSAQELPGYVGINVYNKYNRFKTPEELGDDANHELPHTLKIDHPFEVTQAIDAELIHVGDPKGHDYVTTPRTDPNIQFNVMNYGMIKINGAKLKDLWKDQRPLFLTPGQLKLGLKEILNQMNGAGSGGGGNLLYYYGTSPGTPVQDKTKKP